MGKEDAEKLATTELKKQRANLSQSQNASQRNSNTDLFNKTKNKYH